jgi:hypothetical protein
MKLWIVRFNVRPKAEHPLFFDWQFGFLFVYVLDESENAAGNRALSIVLELPYELPAEEDLFEDGKFKCASRILTESFAPASGLKLGHDAAKESADKLGIGLFLEVLRSRLMSQRAFLPHPKPLFKTGLNPAFASVPFRPICGRFISNLSKSFSNRARLYIGITM